MPYILRSYERGAELSRTADNNAPEAIEGFEQFAQAGWSPVAQGLGLTLNGVYRLDDPGGMKRKIKILAIGAGMNAITYERQGVA